MSFYRLSEGEKLYQAFHLRRYPLRQLKITFSPTVDERYLAVEARLAEDAMQHRERCSFGNGYGVLPPAPGTPRDAVIIPARRNAGMRSFL